MEEQTHDSFNATASGHGQAFVNTGTVHGNVEQKHVVNEAALAQYTLKPYCSYPSLEALKAPTSRQMTVASLTALVGLANAAFDLFGKLGMSSMVSQMFSLTLFVGGASIAYVSGRRLDVLSRLDHAQTLQYNEIFFEHGHDGRVRESSAQATCPVPGCPGTLSVQRLGPNEEGLAVAGRCSERPSQHVFDFHLETMKGAAVKVTPKKPVSSTSQA